MRLPIRVMKRFTPERMSYSRSARRGWGTHGRGTGVTDMQWAGEEHGGRRTEATEVKEAKKMKEVEEAKEGGGES